MRMRILSFIVFQAIAWGLYFNWDGDSNTRQIEPPEKVIQVVEAPSTTLVNSPEVNSEYMLILRNDGFFTKVNFDQSVENGLWVVNYDIPSIILKYPGLDYKYRILEETQDKLEIELINKHEIIQARIEEEKDNDKLFSSSPYLN